MQNVRLIMNNVFYSWLTVILIAFCLSVIFVSCMSGINSESYKGEIDGVKVYTYDGCEYIFHGTKGAHKGNCNNPIHCHNKE